ncbi:hypothetical protein DPMN_018325 [Dreissena polymorpha]|uniref:Uncharacterized protein n=1 Tax=Dreissena polymorpha TaxID=45954 RepID=A0A9D4S911_DREPO|nr:hypothetical protein DPMN_018325 [Dreissena polymorpha]
MDEIAMSENKESRKIIFFLLHTRASEYLRVSENLDLLRIEYSHHLTRTVIRAFIPKESRTFESPLVETTSLFDDCYPTEHGQSYICFRFESWNVIACCSACSRLAYCTSMFFTPAVGDCQLHKTTINRRQHVPGRKGSDVIKRGLCASIVQMQYSDVRMELCQSFP